MAANVGQLSPRRTVPVVRPRGRFHGLGSVYAKTLRDSTRAVLIMGGLLGVLMLSGGAQYGVPFPTPEARAALATTFRELPDVLKGVYGVPTPANLETLGALVWLKDGAFTAIVAGLWSILALSSTLATEVRRGSFELVAVTPQSPRRIVLQKLAAHLTAMAIVLGVVAFTVWLTCILFGTVPGDAIPAGAAIGFALWVGLVALASGALAFALAPLTGRAPAAGIAGAVLVGGMLLNGYRAVSPTLSGWANLTWFGWTVQHQPLAGQYDWASLVPVALVALVLFALGTELFVRRDLGDAGAIPWPGFPAATLGLGGPTARSFGERLPMALAWGLGFGLFALVSANADGGFRGLMAVAPAESLNLVRALYPNIDFAVPGAFLQIAVLQIGFIFAGLAAWTLVRGWASDETSRRLELILTTPLSRVRWAFASGLGVFLAIAVLNAVLALAVGAGAALGGSDPRIPVLGTVVLGLYAAALAGTGLAIGGLFRASAAATAVVALVIATFLLDLLGPALQLPGWVAQLALTAHFGQPMVGNWDWTGIAACLALALGGLALSAWGIRRRDIAS